MHCMLFTQRDYDKAEQECQRYKTLYDAAKEEVLVHVHVHVACTCTCTCSIP